MASLIFDIETSALPKDHFDDVVLEYLFRPAASEMNPDAKQAKQEEIERLFSLWPFTAEVVCIAMLNAETRRGKVFYVAEDYEEEETQDGPVSFVTFLDETEMLAAFWETAKHYENIITFNGLCSNFVIENG